MKRTIVTLMTLISLSVMQGQRVKFGVKTGLNIATIHGSNVSNSEMIPRAYFGGYLNLDIANKFHFQPELIYSLQGYKMSNYYAYNNIKDHLNYINLPLIFQYDVAKKIYVETGPQIGYLCGRKLSYTTNNYFYGSSNTSSTDASGLNKIDFGLNIGAGYRINHKFGISSRFFYGITNFAGGDDKFKNETIQIGANYNF